MGEKGGAIEGFGIGMDGWMGLGWDGIDRVDLRLMDFGVDG